MDVDWCLTCEKRLEAPNVYCSQDCRCLAASTSSTLLNQDEGDRSIILHTVDVISPRRLPETHSRWTGNDSAGISAWAAEVPYGPPAEQPRFPSHTVCRPPQLLSRKPRIVPPSLSKNTPQVILPRSSPLQTPKPSHATVQASEATRRSLKSVLTESSLATPASSQPVPISTTSVDLSSIYSHVRSWMKPSSSLAQFKPAASHKKVKPSKLTLSVRPPPVKVVFPPHGLLEDSSFQWMASAILLEQPHKRAPGHRQLRERRLPHKFPRLDDQDPSFRARGRKLSRAVA